MHKKARLFFTLLILVSCLPSCAMWLFSPAVFLPDKSRPVVKIETQNGYEYGAATSEGILFLNQNGAKGPCRITYYLGSRQMIEAGEIVPFGGVYYHAVMELKHEWAPVLTRDLTPKDELWVILMRGHDQEVERIPVTLANDEGVEGDVLAWPGRELPAGTAVWVRVGEGHYTFAGLISSKATIENDGNLRQYYLFTGPSRLREALAVPRPTHPVTEIKYRRDDITVIKKK